MRSRYGLRNKKITVSSSWPELGTDWVVGKRLLAYTMRHFSLLLVALTGLACFAATDAGLAMIIKPLLDEGFSLDESGQSVAWIPGTLLLLLLLRGVGGIVGNYYLASVGHRIVRQLRLAAYERLQSLPASFFDNIRTGHLVTRVSANARQAAELGAMAVATVSRDLLSVLGLTVWMLYLNWAMALIYLIFLPFMVVLSIVALKNFRRANLRVQESLGLVSDDVGQLVKDNQAVKLYGSSNLGLANFMKTVAQNLRLNLRLALYDATNVSLVSLLGGLGLTLVIYVTTSTTLIQEVSGGEMASFLTAVLLLIKPLRSLARLNATVARSLTAARSVFEIMDSPVEPCPGGQEKPDLQGRISFLNVSFSYSGNGFPALQNINLEIPEKSLIVLVGKSGSGKSSLANLVPILYRPTRGRILVDGRDVSTFPLRSLRSCIAYVTQFPTLARDTLENNISYGLKVSREEIHEAAEKAHIMEFVDALPQGFDTVLGEEGWQLSGGQRQRVAIARALLRRASILIFDEATSALDAISEHHIRETLVEISQSCTTIIISHRFEMAIRADMVVVLESGAIVERGTHRQLLSSGGAYSKLYAAQNKRDDAA